MIIYYFRLRSEGNHRSGVGDGEADLVTIKTKTMNQLHLALLFIILSLSTTFTVENQASDIIILPVESVAELEWSPDGALLALLTWPDIQIWETDTWELVLVIPEAYANDITWHPDSTQIATVRGGRVETLLIWDAHTGNLLLEEYHWLPVFGARIVHDLVWHPNGNRIFTDTSELDSRTLLLWQLDAEKMPIIFVRPDSPTDRYNAWTLDISNDGRYLLTSGDVAGDWVPYPGWGLRMIRIWDIESGRVFLQIEGNQTIWGPNDELLTVHQDQYYGHSLIIHIWDYTTEQIIITYNEHATGLVDISWNYNENIIASTDINENLFIWDAITGETYLWEQISKGYGYIHHDWRPNSNQLAYSTWDQVVIRTFDF